MALFNFLRSKPASRHVRTIEASEDRMADTLDISDTLDVVESDTIQLVEERLDVDTVFVPGDTLRVSTKTDTVQEEVALNLRKEHYDVVRVSVDQVVDSVPEIRRENGVTVIPVMEERAVVVKQLVLVEELHIREGHTVEPHREIVELRRQRAVVDREAADVV